MTDAQQRAAAKRFLKMKLSVSYNVDKSKSVVLPAINQQQPHTDKNYQK
jgi:hypothetical protein